MAKVVTLGEIMLRLSSPLNSRIVNANTFDVCYGGGEANVAVSLAHYGHDAYYISKLPTNSVGEAAFNALRSEGVKVDYIVRGGARLGIYFLETGSAMRASQVTYDRANSAIATSSVKEYQLKEAEYYNQVLDFVEKEEKEDLIKEARHKFDFNYRNKVSHLFNHDYDYELKNVFSNCVLIELLLLILIDSSIFRIHPFEAVVLGLVG